MAPDKSILDAISEKVKNSEQLTTYEERLYLLYVLHFPEDEVERILAKSDEKYRNALID